MGAVVRPAPQQTETGNPSVGRYDVLVNAYITPYAKVTVYDNWILFGGLGAGVHPGEGVITMDPTKGSTASAVDYALGNATSTTLVPGTLNSCDLAGLKIDTNSRLDLVVDMGGWLTRVTDTGTAFAGVDTRKTVAGSYQLRNQFKVKFRGKFLDGISNPAEDSAGAAIASPTSSTLLTPEYTAYNTWTKWDTGSDVIDTENGWQFPIATGAADAWTGDAVAANCTGTFNLVVERGQSDTWSGTTGNTAAQMWFAQRILRRGLQDVSGNYREDISIYLTYREAPASWTPAHIH